MLCSLFALLASPARAAEPPLAVSASVQGAILTVVVFSDAPTDAEVRVQLPPGWSSSQALDVRVSVGSPRVLVWHLHAGVGLGIILVRATDARGNSVGTAAYSQGATIESRAPIGARLWMPIVRR